MHKNIKAFIFLIIISAIAGNHWYSNYKEEKEAELIRESLSFVKESVSQQIVSENYFPDLIKFNEEDIGIRYTIDRKLQEGVEKLIKRYANDHTAVVIIDNNNGEIKAIAGVEREERRLNFSLPFSSTHPSASLFKIITSADLLDNDKLDPQSKLNYRGRGTTLYKYQLKNKVNRWTRWISFKKAFAYSNNVIFGKAAIQNSTGASIFKRAYSFGFNRQLMYDFNLGPSRFIMPESQYQLAEMASGFNKKTLISPVHAAMLSSIVASGGFLSSPKIISDVLIMDKTHHFPSISEKVLDDETVMDLEKLMAHTVERGTARGLRKGRTGRMLMKKYFLGAKTGSITGGIPEGKRDWLTYFAKPKGPSEDKGFSVAVMNINGKKWYHKSSFIGREILYLIDKLQEEGQGS